MAAGVAALVDDDAVLVELPAELFVESDDAGNRCVRHVHVADAAVSSFCNLAAIGFDPIEVMRAILVGDGLDGDIPRAVRRRLGVDLQRNDLPGKILEVGVDVDIGADFTAINSDEVIAGFDLQARFGERRAGGFGPIFTGINFCDAIVVAGSLEIGGKQADANSCRLGLVA